VSADVRARVDSKEVRDWIKSQIDQPFLPFVFDISMGVRREDQDLKDQIEQILETRRAEIDRILEDYKVPRVDQEKGASGV